MEKFIERFMGLVPNAEAYTLRDGVVYASTRHGSVVLSIECGRRGSIRYALSPIYDEADALLHVSNRGEIVDLYGTAAELAILVYLAEQCDPELSVLFHADEEVVAAKATDIYQQLRDGTLTIPEAVARVNGDT